MITTWERHRLVLIMMALMIIFQIYYPVEAMVVWPPVLIVLAVKRLYWKEIIKYDWKSLKTGRFWESVGFALTQGMIAQGVGIVIIMHGFGITKPEVPIDLSPLILLSSIIIAPIIEELVFRKILFSSLSKFTGYWPAATISSVLFAIAHSDYSASLGYFLLGLVWCRAYRKSGNLGVVIAAHVIFNAIAFIAMGLRG